MILEIIDVKNNADFARERIVLSVLADGNIKNYMLIDNTYDEEDRLSNKVRHPFFFPDLSVKKGEIVRVYTKTGKYSITEEKFDPKTKETTPLNHNLFWGLRESIWNNEGDCALLVKIAGWQRFCVKG